MNLSPEDIEDLRMGTMFLVDAVARAEGWPPEKYEGVAYAISRQPWYAVYIDQAYFRECLCAAAHSRGKAA